MPKDNIDLQEGFFQFYKMNYFKKQLLFFKTLDTIEKSFIF